MPAGHAIQIGGEWGARSLRTTADLSSTPVRRVIFCANLCRDDLKHETDNRTGLQPGESGSLFVRQPGLFEQQD